MPPADEPANYIDYQGPQGTYPPLPIENLFVEQIVDQPADQFGGLVFKQQDCHRRTRWRK
jgi:hypothetical protein